MPNTFLARTQRRRARTKRSTHSNGRADECPRALLRLARELRPRERADGTGCCLYLSLELARGARALGIATRLVRWQLRGDPEFREHWAVLVGRATILDLSHWTADGGMRTVWRMSDYSADFQTPRIYSTDAALTLYESWRAGSQRRLPGGFLRALRWQILRSDLAHAIRTVRPSAALLALSDGLEFALVHNLMNLRDRLTRRQQVLQARLSEAASMPR